MQVVNVGKQIEVQAANREDVPQYWGYRVRVEKRSFGKLMENGNFDLKIATARIGDNFMDVVRQDKCKMGRKPTCFGGVWCSFAWLA